MRTARLLAALSDFRAAERKRVTEIVKATGISIAR